MMIDINDIKIINEEEVIRTIVKTIEDAETAYELGDEELISEIDSSLFDLEKSLDKFDFQKITCYYEWAVNYRP